jgi:hypothetical protein
LVLPRNTLGFHKQFGPTYRTLTAVSSSASRCKKSGSRTMCQKDDQSIFDTASPLRRYKRGGRHFCNTSEKKVLSRIPEDGPSRQDIEYRDAVSRLKVGGPQSNGLRHSATGFDLKPNSVFFSQCLNAVSAGVNSSPANLLPRQPETLQSRLPSRWTCDLQQSPGLKGLDSSRFREVC